MTSTSPSEPPTYEFDRTRRSLLTRLKNWDDNVGWKEFMDRYGRFIFNLARRAGLSREESEDIVQDTLLSLAKKIPNFRYQGEKGSFKAWLVMIVKSRIIDYLRKKHRRVPDAASQSRNDPDATRLEERLAQKEDELSHESMWQSEWEAHLLETAMTRVKDRVPAKHFLAFRLCSQQGKSPAEVARALALSLPMVYLIRHRVGRQVAAEIRRLSDGL